MATNSATPAAPSNPAAAAPDEHTGVYGFFRRHQKKLLYTAGLFTLLTFSITGPMLSVVDEIFGRTQPMPTILVGDTRVALTTEDYQFAETMARNAGTTLQRLLPPIRAGEGGPSELSTSLAILRRAAIAEGIDVSMVEVDRSIEAVREQLKIDSVVQMASLRGYRSLAEYREVVREAMRVGNYVRLQTLALDGSDAKVIERVMADREKITFHAALLDEKVIEAELKAAATISDEDLQKWLDGKSDQEKFRIQAFDTNRLELRFAAAVLVGERQFDPTQWPDVLKDFAPTEDELQLNYDREKEARWKLEGDNTYKPLAEVSAEITRLLQAEQVMNHLLGKLKERMEEVLKPASEALQRDQAAADEAARKVKEVVKSLADKPGDPELTEQLRLANELLPTTQDAVTAASAALEAARTAWDFTAPFLELTADKTGFVVKATSGLRSIDELKDLDANDMGLGQWPMAAQAQSLSTKGMMCFGPARTTKAVVLYQATDVLLRPLKPWTTLKPLVEGAYFTEQAKTQAEAKKKVLEEALLRLAKAKLPEKVAEIEGKRATRTDERMAAWERTTVEGIAAAEKTLAGLKAGTQAQIAWQHKLEALRSELEQKDAHRTTFDTEVGAAIEREIAEEAKKLYRDVIDAAAAEAGFTLVDYGPYVRELSRRPRFDKAYDPTVVFLFRNHSELKEGESTGVVQDATNRRWCFAVCSKVEPLTIEDVTRRDFESLRSGDGLYSFATQQAYGSYEQAFTLDALKVRYGFEEPVGRSGK